MYQEEYREEGIMDKDEITSFIATWDVKTYRVSLNRSGKLFALLSKTVLVRTYAGNFLGMLKCIRKSIGKKESWIRMK